MSAVIIALPRGARAGAGVRPSQRARGRARAARPRAQRLQAPTVHEHPEPDQPRGHGDHALQLRRGQPERDLAVAPDELDHEALEPRADEVEREHDARPHAIAELPEPPRQQAHQDRLVDRRRQHSARRAASARCRADSPSRSAVSSGCRSRRRRTPGSRCGRSRSRARARWRTCRASAVRARAPAHPADHRDRAADRAAVPDQAGAREDVADHGAVRVSRRSGSGSRRGPR